MTKPTNERSQPLTEREMQVTPLPGEVNPQDARRIAKHIATVERLRQEAALRRAQSKTKP
ncbi:MAG TPA: hypothetical protein VF457_08115 [Burkholderiaceae bacterium]